jgi:DNA ligase 1
MRTQPEYIIRQLENHSSRLNKEAIILAAEKEGLDEFFEGVRMALDPLYTFGVKQVPEASTDGQGLAWANFKVLAQQLNRRELTGHAARDAIKLCMDTATVAQWNYWYRRILIKDLRCGVSEKTINKIKKGAVPVFECMLAHDGTNHENKITGKKLLEPKLDGVRVLTLVDMQSRTAIQFSRNGKVLENFSHITRAIEDNIDLIGRSVVLDGEIVSSSFQELMKQVHRKENVQADDAVLMLFDIIPLSEFRQGKSIMGQKRRSNMLKGMKEIFSKIGNIGIVPQIEVDLDSYVGELEFKEFNKTAIVDGYEGILVKDPNAPYVCKRHVAWLKIKPFLTVDLAVVGVEEGTGKNTGKLGALVCEGTDQDKFIRVNVGSGWSDDQRSEIWSNKDSIIGQIVEVKADCITKSQDAENTYSLRFPRFERFRGFSSGDKM